MTAAQPKQFAAATGERHRFVAPLAWDIEIEREGSMRKVDEVRLEQVGGLYRRVARRAAAKPRGTHLRFRFPRGPEGRYDVWVRSQGVDYCVFRGIELPADHDDLRPPEPPPTVDDVSRKVPYPLLDEIGRR